VQADKGRLYSAAPTAAAALGSPAKLGLLHACPSSVVAGQCTVHQPNGLSQGLQLAIDVFAHSERS